MSTESQIPERIGVDIDGVLANFTGPFTELVNEMFNLEVPHNPVSWNWYRDYDVTEEMDQRLWIWVTKNPEWWGTLPALPAARMGLAYLRESGAEIYFMTARPGFGVKMITENWLRQRGYPDPTVLIASNKAPIVGSLKIDMFIDDKPETCVEIAERTSAQVFMPDRPWNQGEFAGVTRVPELVDALAIMWGREPETKAAA